jgi:hypothetical protein
MSFPSPKEFFVGGLQGENRDAFGPLLSIRLSDQEVQEVIRPFGFKMNRASEVGPYHYQFTASIGR